MPILPPQIYKSKFGGMWIDRSDSLSILLSRVTDGSIPKHLEDPIKKFEEDGYLILRGAASDAVITNFERSISKAFRDGHDNLIVQKSDSELKLDPTGKHRGVRIVDAFAVFPEALNLLSSPRLTELMSILFDARPLLFQSLSFNMGSEQGMHQDTAYVVVDRPMEMLAAWVALEDVKPGSGELQYLVGSHRLGDFPFAGDSRKHWDSNEDGYQKHAEWAQWILQKSEALGLTLKKFHASRGDILIWHADLAHGGSNISNPNLTRKSLVGHFCPASANPYYMKVSPNRKTKLRYGDIDYASWHYDLSLPE